MKGLAGSHPGRLTGQQMNELRRRWIAAGDQPNATEVRQALALEFGISRSTLWLVAKKRGWPRANRNQ